MALRPAPAAAQLAPTGAHYGARESDTGFAGAANSQGAYDAAVPLDLPAARGGMPVPLRVSYGGRRVGAAGLGWDVPLTFVFRDTTLAHRRPANDPASAPLPREQVYVVLDGARVDFVRNAADTAWLARRDGPQLELRDLGGGSMVMYDGAGRTYNFSAEAGAAGTRLAGGNLYLLRDITGSTGNVVHLEYALTTPALPNGGLGDGINLSSISYNTNPTTAGCFKHIVQLGYDAPAPAPALPLAMSPFGTSMLVRTNKLILIDVLARATCGASATRLRRYTLAYQADPDTRQPRLQSVTMQGQERTPEGDQSFPVATYTYGTATGVDGKLTYRATQSIPVPAGIDTTFGISYTSEHTDGDGNDDGLPIASLLHQNLQDVDGDGRPDFYRDGTIAKNVPGPNGTTMFLPGVAGGPTGFSPATTSYEPVRTAWRMAIRT